MAALGMAALMMLGSLCVRTGYPAAFALTGALILAVIPLARRESR